MEKKKFKLGLLPKLLIAIVLGIIIGQFFPVWFCRVVVTASSIFSSFLKFVIPLMIVAYVTMGIADLKSGAGKLLLITVALAYGSTLIAGSASYLVSANLFPSFMSEGALEQIAATADNSLASYISISIPPILDTLSAVVLAFVLGLCMSTLRGKTIGDTLYNGMKDFSGIIDQVLHSVIIPLLPLYVCGTFIDMTKSGKTFAIGIVFLHFNGAVGFYKSRHDDLHDRLGVIALAHTDDGRKFRASIIADMGDEVFAVIIACIDRHMGNAAGRDMLEYDQRPDGNFLRRIEIISVRALRKADASGLAAFYPAVCRSVIGGCRSRVGRARHSGGVDMRHIRHIVVINIADIGGTAESV